LLALALLIYSPVSVERPVASIVDDDDDNNDKDELSLVVISCWVKMHQTCTTKTEIVRMSLVMLRRRRIQ
jgi:hypothetical protein